MLDDSTRGEYLKPLILLGVGATAIVIVFLSMGGPTFAAVGAAVYLVLLAAQIVLGLLALVIAMSVMGEGAGPLGLAILRLAGIFSVTTATGVALQELGCIGGIMNLGIMALLFMWLFEFEYTEAAVVVGCMIVMSVAIRLLLLPAIAGAF